jgi:hypothetical protein
MSRKSKRELERAFESLSEATGGSLTEMVSGMGLWFGDAPELTDYLATRGFVVERKIRTHDNGHQDVVLYPTPGAMDIFNELTWHSPGPTAPNDAIRIEWSDDALEAALDAAEHPVEHNTVELPADPVTVTEGDGWRAVAARELVAENMVDRRSRAEQQGLKILGNAPPVSDREKHDLVELDAEPVAYSKRSNTLSKV